jgi:hypothetical protein
MPRPPVQISIHPIAARCLMIVISNLPLPNHSREEKGKPSDTYPSHSKAMSGKTLIDDTASKGITHPTMTPDDSQIGYMRKKHPSSLELTRNELVK